jgi:hypothetical protein
MGIFCLSPIEWPAAGPKVGTAACLPSRSVEENFLNNTVDSGALAYTSSRAVRSLAPSYFQNAATLETLIAVTFTSVSANGTQGTNKFQSFTAVYSGQIKEMGAVI